jgi:predicted aldo/keto reductase-like oxidoreductase
MKFIREIHYYLGIRDERLNKTLYKILNLSGNYNILLTKFLLLVSEFDEDDRENILVEDLEKLELIYIDVYNFTHTFKKKELKIKQIMEKYKEKSKN